MTTRTLREYWQWRKERSLTPKEQKAFPKVSPGLGPSLEKYAKYVDEKSSGKELEVFQYGKIVTLICERYEAYVNKEENGILEVQRKELTNTLQRLIRAVEKRHTRYTGKQSGWKGGTYALGKGPKAKITYPHNFKTLERHVGDGRYTMDTDLFDSYRS